MATFPGWPCPRPGRLLQGGLTRPAARVPGRRDTAPRV